jgi:hypothetical protein
VVVTNPVCTFVTTRLDGGLSVLLALLTNPAQPVNNAAEELRTTAHTAHTNPFTVVFTVITLSGLVSAR